MKTSVRSVIHVLMTTRLVSRRVELMLAFVRLRSRAVMVDESGGLSTAGGSDKLLEVRARMKMSNISAVEIHSTAVGWSFDASHVFIHQREASCSNAGLQACRPLWHGTRALRRCKDSAPGPVPCARPHRSGPLQRLHRPLPGARPLQALGLSQSFPLPHLHPASTRRVKSRRTRSSATSNILNIYTLPGVVLCRQHHQLRPWRNLTSPTLRS